MHITHSADYYGISPIHTFFKIIFDFPLTRRDCRPGLDAIEAANPHEYNVFAGLRPLFVRLGLRDKTTNGAQMVPKFSEPL